MYDENPSTMLIPFSENCPSTLDSLFCKVYFVGASNALWLFSSVTVVNSLFPLLSRLACAGRSLVMFSLFARLGYHSWTIEKNNWVGKLWIGGKWVKMPRIIAGNCEENCNSFIFFYIFCFLFSFDVKRSKYVYIELRTYAGIIQRVCHWKKNLFCAISIITSFLQQQRIRSWLMISALLLQCRVAGFHWK